MQLRPARRTSTPPLKRRKYNSSIDSDCSRKCGASTTAATGPRVRSSRARGKTAVPTRAASLSPIPPPPPPPPERIRFMLNERTAVLLEQPHLYYSVMAEENRLDGLRQTATDWSVPKCLDAPEDDALYAAIFSSAEKSRTKLSGTETDSMLASALSGDDCYLLSTLDAIASAPSLSSTLSSSTLSSAAWPGLPTLEASDFSSEHLHTIDSIIIEEDRPTWSVVLGTAPIFPSSPPCTPSRQRKKTIATSMVTLGTQTPTIPGLALYTRSMQEQERQNQDWEYGQFLMANCAGSLATLPEHGDIQDILDVSHLPWESVASNNVNLCA